MNIVVTGEVGAGKTTVCQKVLESARNTGYGCGGIITHKMPGDRLSVMDIRTGELAALAAPGDGFPGSLTPRFSFVPEGFEFGIRALETGSGEDILFVDELGIIEVMGEGFISAFDLINKKKPAVSIVVIRRELLEYLLPGFDEEPQVFETTDSTRDRLPGEIVSAVSGNGAACMRSMSMRRK